MKIAAKLLSPSDLTLFEAIFRKNGTSKQKGVNLNGNVLADQFYPSLPRSLASAGELPITLDIHGPNGAPLHRQRRKIVKSAGGKNWRLNGKLVEEPADQPGRYGTLEPGDVALFGFVGDSVPTGVIMVILAQSDPDGAVLRERLIRELGLVRRIRSMAAINTQTLAELANETPANEAIRILLPDPEREEDLQEAALGDADAEGRLQTRTQAGQSRSVTPDELAAAQRRAAEIGRAGEVLVNELLTDERELGSIREYHWDADVDALCAHDFTIERLDGVSELVDAKSTTGLFDGHFHISDAELRKASSTSAPYRVYRVYGLDSTDGPKLRRSGPINEIATKVLGALAGLPAGIKVSSVQMSPSLLDWGPEEPLHPLEEEA